jgi:hypothetical protein
MHSNDARQIRCLLKRSREEIVLAIRLDQTAEAAAHFAQSLEYSGAGALRVEGRDRRGSLTDLTQIKDWGMIKLRFGTGSFDKLDILYQAEWPVVPRIGEKITIPTGSIADWTIRDVCYAGSAKEELIGAFIVVEPIGQ